MEKKEVHRSSLLGTAAQVLPLGRILSWGVGLLLFIISGTWTLALQVAGQADPVVVRSNQEVLDELGNSFHRLEQNDRRQDAAIATLFSDLTMVEARADSSLALQAQTYELLHRFICVQEGGSFAECEKVIRDP